MPLIKTKTNQKEELYLVKLQSKRPKFVGGDAKHASNPCLKKAITLRVMATSDADAQKKALNRKRPPKTKKCGYIVRWSRKFYA